MEALNENTFSHRKFVSLGILFTLVILVATAILIQVFEAIENDFFIHFFTVIHIFNGLAFTILAVLHAKINWKVIMAYFQSKDLSISKEAVCAFWFMAAAILSGILFVFTFLV
ncbi:MAG: hypothetical protein M1445_03740 [Bacteroidetes bacterium]|nr:hypothetical protein [Bacteroidota bacterium]MCL6102500.1 hypothetical protein [Bacteroidota bacterium]